MSRSKGTPVPAPMVGKLLDFKVKVGDVVRENDVVAIIEAMKMHVEVYAPVGGVVQETCGTPGEVVKTGHVLVTIG